ncbi:hypothetical protein [Arthrobacter sp. MDT1-65]
MSCAAGASGDGRAPQIGGRGQRRIERPKLEDYISAAYVTARTDITRGDVDPPPEEAE